MRTCGQACSQYTHPTLPSPNTHTYTRSREVRRKITLVQWNLGTLGVHDCTGLIIPTLVKCVGWSAVASGHIQLIVIKICYLLKFSFHLTWLDCLWIYGSIICHVRSPQQKKVPTSWQLGSRERGRVQFQTSLQGHASKTGLTQ